MKAKALIAAVQCIPDELHMRKNGVGNLSLHNNDGRYMGYIEFWTHGCSINVFDVPYIGDNEITYVISKEFGNDGVEIV